MKLRLIMIGKTDKGFVQEGLAHYLNRLVRTVQLATVILPEAGKGEPAYQQRMEGERVLAALRPGEKLVLLDENGRQFSSVGFAEHLRNWRDQGLREAAFVIGGAYGHGDAVRKKADLIMSLSSMTFPHQLVRVLFAEQLYRAYSIIEGKPYHH